MPEIIIQISDIELRQVLDAHGCDGELNADDSATALIGRVVRDIEDGLENNPTVYSAHQGRMT